MLVAATPHRHVLQADGVEPKELSSKREFRLRRGPSLLRKRRAPPLLFCLRRFRGLRTLEGSGHYNARHTLRDGRVCPRRLGRCSLCDRPRLGPRLLIDGGGAQIRCLVTRATRASHETARATGGFGRRGGGRGAMGGAEQLVCGGRLGPLHRRGRSAEDWRARRACRQGSSVSLLRPASRSVRHRCQVGIGVGRGGRRGGFSARCRPGRIGRMPQADLL